jgi:glutamyl-tRNA reductase
MANFTETFDDLRKTCDEGQQNRRELVEAIRADVAAMARQTAEQLRAQAWQRHEDFKAMMNDLRDTVREQAEQTRKQLAEFSDDLHRGGNTFNKRD